MFPTTSVRGGTEDMAEMSSVVICRQGTTAKTLNVEEIFPPRLSRCGPFTAIVHSQTSAAGCEEAERSLVFDDNLTDRSCDDEGEDKRASPHYRLQRKDVYLCDPCLPGWGLLRQCNETHPTVCQPCPVGTWSPNHPHRKECRLCSRCGPGLYEDDPCTSTRDTKCDSCWNTKGSINADFFRKCGDHQQMVDNRGFSQGGGLKIDDSLMSDSADTSEIIDDDDDDEDDDSDSDSNSESDEGSSRDAAWRAFNRNFFHPHQEGSKDTVGHKHNGGRDFGEGGFERSRLKNRKPTDDSLNSSGAKFDGLSEEVVPPRSGRIPIRIPFLADEKVELNRFDSDGHFYEYGDRLVRFRPSYHDYPVEELLHGQRKKTCVLFIITGMIVPCAIVFLLYYVKRLCQRSRFQQQHGPMLISHLTDEDERIIRHCAQRLHCPTKMRTPLYDPYDGHSCWKAVGVRENPLQAFLDYNDSAVSTDRLMPKESDSDQEKGTATANDHASKRDTV